MASLVEIPTDVKLDEYGAVAHLAGAVQELRLEAEVIRPKLRGRTIWMVNSTPHGGGVAEMLPTMVALLRDLGVQTEWAVIETTEPAFFDLTKRIHNLIHGEGDPGLGDEHHTLFEAVNRENAAFLRDRIKPGDILVVHDPQPMPLATILKEDLDVHAVWRCHIGLDQTTNETQAAWHFLGRYAGAYEHGVFSAPEYVPGFFARRASIICPAINPLTPKNFMFRLHKVVGILANSGLARPPGPLLTPPYEHRAQRLNPDGQFHQANAFDDFGLLTRPIVTQVSRWDRLKGWAPLMQAFVDLKTNAFDGNGSTDPVHKRRRGLARLVLAGPDPDSIRDDPEGLGVIEELKSDYLALDRRVQKSIAFITLPMQSATENALMVNALQRASSLVVQNSLREGFGLTVTEAMWKRAPILSNTQACGPRQQVRDRIDGRLVDDPTDTGALATTLDEMLSVAEERAIWGRNAQRQVHDRFLIFAQLGEWLRLLGRVVDGQH